MIIREAGRLLRSGKLSCVELTQQTLADIKKRDSFRSVITLMEDSAIDQAEQLDREFRAGIVRGPFHGVPIAYKDLFYTKGTRTTGGSLLFRDFIPEHDATVVERLTNAGAICIAKTNLHELAYGISSKNPHFGFVLNPRDTNRLAGGSSGGSATLVAAGFVPMCLGSDTGGSIRIPASFCGITGLKPTYGRVSRRGVLPLAFSLDHVGPLGTCVEDCALTMNVIAGPDERDASCAKIAVSNFNLEISADLKGTRVGVPKNFFFERVRDDVAVAVQNSVRELQGLGATILEVQVPDMGQLNAAARVIQFSETAAIYDRYGDFSQFGEDVWGLIQQGKLVAAHEYVNAQRVRTLFRREFDALWQQVDILATPTTPTPAPLLDDTQVKIGNDYEDTRLASTRLVRGINFLGEPALSLPCGKSAEGLPIGLQLIGPPFKEPELLQIGKALEQVLR